MKYATITDGYIQSISQKDGHQITESEYNEILSIVHNRPEPPAGYEYKLKADSLKWELYKLQPEDEV